MRKPTLNARVARGLRGVHALVDADLVSMTDVDGKWSHPWSPDDLLAAVEYIGRLEEWYWATRGIRPRQETG